MVCPGCSKCSANLETKHLLEPFQHAQRDVVVRVRNNDVPQPDTGEHQNLLQLVQMGKESVELYKKEIRRLEETMQRLLVLTTRTESLFSPIRNLPREVIENIFVMFIEDTGPSLLHISDRKIHPNTLGAVCKHWRDLTLSIPKLWTALSVDITVQGNLVDEKQRLITDTFLSRSWAPVGPQPLLNLGICCQNLSTDPTLKSGSLPLLPTLAPYLYRVWRLTMNVEPFLLKGQLLASFYGSFAALEYLAIGQDARDYGDYSRWDPCGLFEVAPRLRTVQLAYSCDHFILPLQQITRLASGIWSDSSLVNDLQSYCDYTQSLSIDLHGSAFPLAIAINLWKPLVLHCRLLQVDVTVFELGNPFYSVPPFSFPDLEIFLVRDIAHFPSPKSHANFSLALLHNWTLHSGSRLHCLVLENVSLMDMPFSRLSLAIILGNLPMLEELTVKEAPCRVHLLSVLDESLLDSMNTFQEHYILPNLKSVDFSVGKGSNTFSSISFVSMLQSRVGSLQKVLIKWQDAEILMSRCRGLKEDEGMDITIFDEDNRLL